MAYCNKCGAYLPDNFTKCLACGYDEEAERAAAAQAAAEKESAPSGGRAYQFSSNELKKQLEQQRKKQQEASRRWAEQERARRQAAAREAAREAEVDEEPGEFRGEKKAKGSAAIPNKVLAALSYLSALCFLPFFLCPGDDYARFHAKQGLRLLVFSAVADLLSAIPLIGWVFPVFRIYCIYKGMMAANEGRCDPLPYIGTIGNF